MQLGICVEGENVFIVLIMFRIINLYFILENILLILCFDGLLLEMHPMTSLNSNNDEQDQTMIRIAISTTFIVGNNWNNK